MVIRRLEGLMIGDGVFDLGVAGWGREIRGLSDGGLGEFGLGAGCRMGDWGNGMGGSFGWVMVLF